MPSISLSPKQRIGSIASPSRRLSAATRTSRLFCLLVGGATISGARLHVAMTQVSTVGVRVQHLAGQAVLDVFRHIEPRLPGRITA